jgi:hypothetical protein
MKLAELQFLLNKLTVYYVMKATSIEVKGEPKKAEPKAASKKI